MNIPYFFLTIYVLLFLSQRINVQDIIGEYIKSKVWQKIIYDVMNGIVVGLVLGVTIGALIGGVVILFTSGIVVLFTYRITELVNGVTIGADIVSAFGFLIGLIVGTVRGIVYSFKEK
ncbi:hypothetical protein [Bartonella sp. DGB1]|uniref:hypothetical protein n=1 Tax=Bartonella sp. DGB1 TaxID=3239807 RepID=UPI0035263971